MKESLHIKLRGAKLPTRETGTETQRVTVSHSKAQRQPGTEPEIDIEEWQDSVGL